MALHVAMDRRTGDAEKSGELGMVALVEQLVQVPTLCDSKPGRLSAHCPFAFATAMPSLVLLRMRSDTNSTTIPRTFSSSRPMGSVGLWTLAPRLTAIPLREFVSDVTRVRQ